VKLIVGLGNVGAQYAKTRHNIGFMVVDELAGRLDASWKLETKFKAELAEVTRDGERIILAKPHTMMNLSGEAVQKIAQFYKLSPADIWVLYDDVDVPFGRLRLRQGGSSGQQGVRSIISHISPEFRRVRLGISLNDRTVEPSEVYVLKPFKPEEAQALPRVLAGAADFIADHLAGDTPTEITVDLLA
jgi:PTH1 family peptidyl-tRNA hydrolase